MNKFLITILTMAFANLATAGSTDSMINALLKKGVITEEEANKILNEASQEKKAEVKARVKEASNDSLPITPIGVIRTHVEQDNINTPEKQPDVRVGSLISRIGIKFKEPITTVGEGWVINGQYETSFQSDNPRLVNTFIGDQQSTIGVASNYVDAVAEYKIDIGRKSHTLWNVFKTHGLFNDELGTPMGEIHSRQMMFFSNGIYLQYRPSYLPGITVNYDHSMSEKDGVRNRHVWGARYDQPDWNILLYRFNDETGGNNSTMLAGMYKIPSWKTKITAILTNDRQQGIPFSAAGQRTQGASTQITYNVTEDALLLAGLGRRSDGVNTYTAGVDYTLSKRTIFQIHYAHTEANEPIVFTTANDFGPLLGINGGGAAATATRRDQFGMGFRFQF
jgi:predicted porin